MKNTRFVFLLRGRKMNRNSILDIARFFLSKNEKDMTHKKLQKLCYYAYAWSLALRDELLFDEKFQAWVHGPVSPVLYQRYKKFGWQPIPYENPPSLEQEELELLEEVYKNYGIFTGDELETLTHTETPWLEARGNIAPYKASQNLLSDTTIKDFYLNIYEQAQND